MEILKLPPPKTKYVKKNNWILPMLDNLVDKQKSRYMPRADNTTKSSTSS